MSVRTKAVQARGVAKVEVPFMFAIPGREARLGGWEKWERHMLRINAPHVLAIVQGEYLVLCEENVHQMKPERVKELAERALAIGPPRLSLRSRVVDWVLGTWRYYRRPTA